MRSGWLDLSLPCSRSCIYVTSKQSYLLIYRYFIYEFLQFLLDSLSSRFNPKCFYLYLIDWSLEKPHLYFTQANSSTSPFYWRIVWLALNNYFLVNLLFSKGLLHFQTLVSRLIRYPSLIWHRFFPINFYFRKFSFD